MLKAQPARVFAFSRPWSADESMITKARAGSSQPAMGVASSSKTARSCSTSKAGSTHGQGLSNGGPRHLRCFVRISTSASTCANAVTAAGDDDHNPLMVSTCSGPWSAGRAGRRGDAGSRVRYHCRGMRYTMAARSARRARLARLPRTNRRPIAGMNGVVHASNGRICPIEYDTRHESAPVGSTAYVTDARRTTPP